MASARYQDEDMGDVQEARPSRLKSTVTAVRKQKGRGFREGDMDIDDDRSNAQQYESLQTTSKAGAGQKCEVPFLFVPLLLLLGREFCQEQAHYGCLSSFSRDQRESVRISMLYGTLLRPVKLEY